VLLRKSELVVSNVVLNNKIYLLIYCTAVRRRHNSAVAISVNTSAVLLIICEKELSYLYMTANARKYCFVLIDTRFNALIVAKELNFLGATPLSDNNTVRFV